MPEALHCSEPTLTYRPSYYCTPGTVLSPKSASKTHHLHSPVTIMPQKGNTISTRLLILSDTHVYSFPHNLLPSTPIDILIHCGDLTEESKVSEYNESINLLRAIQAPLKFVIPGNHDFTLDTTAFQRILQSSGLNLSDDEEVIRREYGHFGQVEAMFTEAAASGIKLLHERTHTFILANGAKLTIYASPFTPSKHATWGFQYIPNPVSISEPQSYPNDGHTCAIPDNIDIAITHCPPLGILDRTHDAKRGGSHGIFAAIENARPRLH